jgi:5-hydroxyisourate hydrolase-like protein (transthyretin family)
MGGREDGRADARVTLTVTATEATRGQNLDVHGAVSAEGEPCAGVRVEIVLRAATPHAKDVVVGSLATDAHGDFGGALVVPSSVPLGDYEVHARTGGDMRCGRAESP